MVDQYIFSGSLPENASTYVTREADAQLYEGLKAGKFCYVLNSRQSGKSSLRVRTMQRLRQEGVECAAVDLSAGGIQNVPPEQWYADLIDTLIDSFGLDVNFGDWWEANQLNSLVTRFRKFLEEILLVEVKENIVIFIDEIDSVLSLNFPTDDFFALIRACYNKRVDNSDYNRLSFCLLGVASPSNLIEDKQRTPFNIGQAISLKGFQIHEAEPLEKGLHSKFSNPQAIMQKILRWTGGQPFMTQKLCQFMVEESDQENPRSVEQVVRSRIIENWESQDEPEHLRTIQARILRDEQRAGYLLELYQQIRLAEERSQVIADETLEQSELQLSGLVVRQQGKLRIYNQIYREIFNLNWIENQLNNLRPYSENFRFWVASKGTDESRLLRGKALQWAEEWARDKNLSYQDKQFLAASKEKEIQEEIAVKQQEAALERERQDREALEGRNQLLSAANKKAQRRISIGVFVLVMTLAVACVLAILSNKKITEANTQVAESKNKTQKIKIQIGEAQRKIENLKQNEKTIVQRANDAQIRQKEALKKNQNLEQELQSNQRILSEVKTQKQNLENESFKLQQKAYKANNELENKNQQLLSLAKTRQQFETLFNQLKQSFKIAQRQLNTTQKDYSLFQKQVAESKEYLQTLDHLGQLALQLQNDGFLTQAQELYLKAGRSVNLSYSRRLALLNLEISFGYQKIREKNLQKAAFFFKKAEEYLNKEQLVLDNDKEYAQILILALQIKGKLFDANQDRNNAIKYFKEAFKIFNNKIKFLDDKDKSTIISFQNVESFHKELIELLLRRTYKKIQINQEELKLARDVIESLHLTKVNNFLGADNLILNQKSIEIGEIDKTAAVIYPVILAERIEVIVSLPKQSVNNESEFFQSQAVYRSQTEIERTIHTLGREQSTPNSSLFRELSIKVYDWVIKDIEPQLKKHNIKNLVFVLDGSLQNVSMAALYDREQEQYLIQKGYNIALAPAGLNLIDFNYLSREKPRVLAAGISEKLDNISLPGIEEEIRNIKNLLPSSYVLLNNQVTKTTLEKAIKTFFPSVVHLAVPFLSASSAENTFILVRKESEGKDNSERLNIKKLSSLLKTRDTTQKGTIDLLVLSSCSENNNGIEMAGLSVNSGVKSILGALLSVNDQATADFMIEFYKQLANPEISKAEAVRRAQLSLLEKHHYYENPYYWSPYILVGNWL
ncbi:CHAT domain-containing protein [Nostoc sp. FACHB-87]|uniref:CHAT domain-containing protein n=1 Tax=Nostocaceae TaxID=1162 RepID=UPI00168765B2|nr:MULTISPECIES: CHAT domain-containing protein [Nostocaceae]MBD2457699.1 CHAT domain-containing protein [Nostoc sp. FACHB-87]MBD2478838.1 CHAT domain-containing protein [Anabaena sp. FACHB-83]